MREAVGRLRESRGRSVALWRGAREGGGEGEREGAGGAKRGEEGGGQPLWLCMFPEGTDFS